MVDESAPSVISLGTWESAHLQESRLEGQIS